MSFTAKAAKSAKDEEARQGRRIDLKDIGETNVMVPVEIED